MASPSGDSAPRRAPRSWLVVLAAVVSGLSIPISVVAWDIQNTLLKTDHWVETTRPMLRSDDARRDLALVLTDRMARSAECSSDAVSIFLSTGLGRHMQARVVRQVDSVLTSKTAQKLWVASNRTAHRSFVRFASAEPHASKGQLDEIALLLNITAIVSKHADTARECADVRSSTAVRFADGDGMRGAASLARAMHRIHVLPALIAGIAIALLGMALGTAHDRRARMTGLIGFAAAMVVASALLRIEVSLAPGQLTNGLSTTHQRALGHSILEFALSPLRLHTVVLASLGGIIGVVAIRFRNAL